jgi:hypothetical protein
MLRFILILSFFLVSVVTKASVLTFNHSSGGYEDFLIQIIEEYPKENCLALLEAIYVCLMRYVRFISLCN